MREDTSRAKRGPRAQLKCSPPVFGSAARHRRQWRLAARLRIGRNGLGIRRSRCVSWRCIGGSWSRRIITWRRRGVDGRRRSVVRVVRVRAVIVWRRIVRIAVSISVIGSGRIDWEAKSNSDTDSHAGGSGWRTKQRSHEQCDARGEYASCLHDQSLQCAPPRISSPPRDEIIAIWAQLPNTSSRPLASVTAGQGIIGTFWSGLKVVRS
jgi:hypothetical protein